MRYKNILLIDDDVEDQEIFKEALDEISNELQFNAYSNPIAALENLAKQAVNPDIIFLDLNMPIMSGQEFLTKIKKQEALQHIPVIIFSTSSNQETINLTKELGALDFITKPNRFDLLIEKLKMVIQ